MTRIVNGHQSGEGSTLKQSESLIHPSVDESGSHPLLGLGRRRSSSLTKSSSLEIGHRGSTKSNYTNDNGRNIRPKNFFIPETPNNQLEHVDLDDIFQKKVTVIQDV